MIDTQLCVDTYDDHLTYPELVRETLVVDDLHRPLGGQDLLHCVQVESPTAPAVEVHQHAWNIRLDKLSLNDKSKRRIREIHKVQKFDKLLKIEVYLLLRTMIIFISAIRIPRTPKL